MTIMMSIGRLYCTSNTGVEVHQKSGIEVMNKMGDIKIKETSQRINNVWQW